MPVPDLQPLFDLFDLANREGPRGITVTTQTALEVDDSPLKTTKSIVVPHVRLEVASGDIGSRRRPMGFNNDVFYLILMNCVKGLFLHANNRYILTPDMFVSKISMMREVCSGFYFSMLDCWHLLQAEFIEQMKLYMIREPEVNLRHRWTMKKIMATLDPSLSYVLHGGGSRDIDASANTMCWALRRRLMRHLRYHCATYFIILFWNDTKIKNLRTNANDIDSIKKNVEGIPTLCGFAYYLDKSFGEVINESLCAGMSCSDTIALFYEDDRTPPWNMLFAGETGPKDLESYLSEERRARKEQLVMAKLMCAPPDLFGGDATWPCLSNIGSLKTYIFKDEEIVVTPPIRRAIYAELIAEITLPMRLLLRPGMMGWTPQPDYFTMNITTDMLTESIRFSNIGDFDVMDGNGNSINRHHFLGTRNFLIDSESLPPYMFAVWADVLLTWSATTSFRGRVNNLPLFRYVVRVQESIKQLLPSLLCVDHYINDEADWARSPLLNDWGRTIFNVDQQVVRVDESFLQQFRFANELPRGQWASSTFFDMASRRVQNEFNDFEMGEFEMDDGEEEDINHGVPETEMPLWTTRVYPDDIAPLISQMNIHWPHHTFETAPTLVTNRKAREEAAKMAKKAKEERRARAMPNRFRSQAAMVSNGGSLDTLFNQQRL